MKSIGTTLLKLLLALSFAVTLSVQAQAACHGRFANPVTDVCWECLFPLTIGHNLSLTGSTFSDVKTDADALCACRGEADVTFGTNLGFWEPIRTVEIVREPFCFPSLGGVTISANDFAPAHGRTPSPKKRGHRTSFYQVHWYHTPWLYLLELLIDTHCIEQSAWDLAYMTELDPLWDDSRASFLLNPDVALFSNPIAIGACSLDCVAASTNLPLNGLYWCAGCAGSLFPLTGWVNAHITDEQAFSLLIQRFTLKLHREGLLWRQWGKDGQCGPQLEFLMSKNVYRTQMLYPSRATQGQCCRPFGATTAIDALGGQTPPVVGEDAVYLLWRRRDCCQGMNLSDAAQSPGVGS